jgi:hypothetical protein
VSERRDRKREAEAERERDPKAADRPGADVNRNGDCVEAEEKNRNVPSASAPRCRPIVDESISLSFLDESVAVCAERTKTPSQKVSTANDRLPARPGSHMLSRLRRDAPLLCLAGFEVGRAR